MTIILYLDKSHPGDESEAGIGDAILVVHVKCLIVHGHAKRVAHEFALIPSLPFAFLEQCTGKSSIVRVVDALTKQCSQQMENDNGQQLANNERRNDPLELMIVVVSLEEDIDQQCTVARDLSDQKAKQVLAIHFVAIQKQNKCFNLNCTNFEQNAFRCHTAPVRNGAHGEQFVRISRPMLNQFDKDVAVRSCHSTVLEQQQNEQKVKGESNVEHCPVEKPLIRTDVGDRVGYQLNVPLAELHIESNERPILKNQKD